MLMLRVDNFTYGVLTPALAFVMSWLGAFTGLRCTSRARAYQGPPRAFWRLLPAAAPAFWFALRLRGIAASIGAALIMAAAVSGMHYTGMAAMRVWPAAGGGMAIGGVSGATFLVPLIVGITVAAILLIGYVALG